MADISVPDEQQSRPTLQEPNASTASLAHWSFLIGYVVPFASLIIPLVLYNTTGKEDNFVRENAKEALNLVICSFIAILISIPLCFVLIGFLLLMLIGLYLLIFPIIASVQTMGALQGASPYKYPVIFRFLN
jgi:uncharacterized protein